MNEPTSYFEHTYVWTTSTSECVAEEAVATATRCFGSILRSMNQSIFLALIDFHSGPYLRTIEQNYLACLQLLGLQLS